MAIEIVEVTDPALLTNVADVFDNQVDKQLTAEFVNDPRHHLVVALEDELVVGMCSSVHYVHPDKPAELWINEVGVAETHKRQGIGRQLMEAMLEIGRRLGIAQAWVLTERSNLAATALYASVPGSQPPEDCVLYAFDIPKAESSAAASG